MSCRKVKKHTTDKWDEPRLPGGPWPSFLWLGSRCRLMCGRGSANHVLRTVEYSVLPYGVVQ